MTTMDKRFRHIVLWMLLVVSFSARAESVKHDTIYFYKTWEQMLDQTPSAYIIDPVFDVVTPYEVYIETGNTPRLRGGLEGADVFWFVGVRYKKIVA